MKRIYVLSLVSVLGVLLFPLQWVSTRAHLPLAGSPIPDHSGSWFRQFTAQPAQDAPERLIPLEQLDALPLAEADTDPARRDPRRWPARLGDNNLRQQEIFPGVDLVFAGNKQKMEAVLILKAGADLDGLRFDFPQAESVTADAQGNIWVIAPDGDLGLLRARLSRQNQTVEGGFVAKDGRVSLRVKGHAAGQPLLVRFDVVFPVRAVNLLDRILFRVLKNEEQPVALRPNAPSAPAAITSVTKTVDKTTANPGEMLMYTVTITNNNAGPVNGVTFTDTVDPNTTLNMSSVATSPIGVNDSYTATGNVSITPAVGVLMNDYDPDTGNNTGLTASAAATSANGGNVTMNANGSFTYNPPSGFTGTDTFTYTVSDASGKTDTGTVTITVSDMIWFVNNQASCPCDGRLSNPFNDLAVGANSFNVNAADDPNDNIFIYTGSGNYNAGLTLLNGQQLIGQGAMGTNLQTVLGLTLAPDSAALPAINGTNPSLVTTAASTSAITLGSGNTIRGLTVGNTTASDITGAGFGTLTVSDVTLNGTGQALILTNGNLAAAFTAISASSGANGVSLTTVTGSLTAAGGSLNGPTGAAFNVSGGTVSVTYTGSITQSNNAALVSVSGGHATGMLTFQTGTLSATNGNGLQFDNADGTYNFNGTTTLNGGDAGIDILNGSGGAFSFGTGTAITNPSGIAFNFNGSAGNVTYSGNITKNGASGGQVVLISGQSSGTITFQTNTITNSSSAGTGIELANVDGTVNFNGATTLSGGDNGVDIGTGSGGTINFASGASITSPSGTAFDIANSTANVTYNGNITKGNPGFMVDIHPASAGTITFQTGTLSATDGTGIQLSNVGATVNFNGTTMLNGGDAGIDIITGSTGTFSFSGNTTITDPSGTAFNLVGGTSSVTYSGNITKNNAGTMVSISGGHTTGTITFQTGTVSATTASTGNGLQFDNADGTYNFNGTTTLNGGDAGIDILNGSGGAFNFGGTTITNPTGIAFNVDGTSAAVTGGISISGAISKNNDGKLIDFFNYDTGTATLSGNLSCTSTCDGIEVTNNGSAGTVNFSGSTKTLNTSGSTAVNLDTNTGGTVNFTGGGLDIDTTSGTGFSATNGGTVTVTTGSNPNTIDSTTGTALNVANTTIGASGLTFQSISAGNNTAAADPANGIVLNTTGSSGGLTVTGDNGASNNGSGGVIQHTTGVGISLNSTRNVSLGYMNVQNSGDAGIQGFSVTNFTLNRSNVTSNGNSTSDEGIQFGLFSGNTVGVTGTATITNCDVSGNAHNNVHFRSTSGTLDLLTVTNSTFNNINDTTGANSFLYEASGTSVTTEANMSGCTFSNNSPQRALEVQSHDTGRIGDTSVSPAKYFVVSGSTFTANGIHASFTQDTSSNLAFKLLNNNITQPNTADNVLQAVNVFSSSQSTGGTIVGTISGNTIATNQESISGIDMVIQGRTDATLLIDDNTITGAAPFGNRSISVAFRGPTAALGPAVTHDVTITNNNADNVTGSGGTVGVNFFPLAAISVEADNQSGSFATAPTVRADIRGNTVPTSAAFDLTSGNIQYYEYDGDGTAGEGQDGIGQLVDTAPASANATAQLSSTNTGSVAAVGIDLIAGPINPPPAFAPIDPSQQFRVKPQGSNDAPKDGGSISYVENLHRILRPIFTAFKPHTTAAPLVEGGGKESVPTQSAAKAAQAPQQWAGAKLSWTDYLNATVSYGMAISPQIKAVKQLWRPVLAAFSTPRSYFNPLSLLEKPAAAAEKPTAKPAPEARAKPPLKRSAQDRTRTAQERRPAPERQQPRPPIRVLKAAGMAGTVMVGPFNLPANETVTIMFTVTVNNPFPAGLSSVSNQGRVTADGGVDILTDDPSVGGSANPTVTNINVPDLIATKANNVSGTRTLGSPSWIWTTTLANQGTGAATFAADAVVFRDNLPNSNIGYSNVNTSDASGITGTISCNVSSNDLICTASGGPVIIGVGGSIKVNVTATATAPGAFVNPRGGGQCQVDPEPPTNGTVNEGIEANNTCANTVNVFAPPTLAKAFGGSTTTTIAPGGTTTMSFTFTNPAANPGNLTGVGFTAADTLTGFQLAGTPGLTTNGNCGSPTLTGFTGSSTSVNISGATVTTANPCVVTVNVTSSTPGTHTNNATPTSTQGGTGVISNTATLIVASPPTISKLFGAASVPLNGTTSLTFTITNPNASLGLTGVSFTDMLPAGLVVAAPPNVTGLCNGTVTATPGASAISLSGGSLGSSSPGNTCMISVDVTGTTAGAKDNSVAAASNETGTGPTSATATLNVIAPPTISKAFGAATVPLYTGGSDVSFRTALTFTITNPNSSGTLTGVGFSDTLPSGLVIANGPFTASNACGSSPAPTLSGMVGMNLFSVSGAQVTAGSPCTISLNVRGATPGAKNNISGNVTSTEGGTNNGAGGTAAASLDVFAAATVVKSFSPTGVALNGVSTLTLTITNPAANPGALNGLSFTDTFPAGLEVDATPNALNSCNGMFTDPSNGALGGGDPGLKLAGGSIGSAGGSCTLSVNVKATTTGPKVNNVTVNSTEGGASTQASATLNVGEPPNFSKGFAPAQIKVGETSTLTFNISNANGSQALNNISFSDSFPSGVEVDAAPMAMNNGCGGSFTANAGATSVSFSGGLLGASGSCSLSVKVKATSFGVKDNLTGAISATESGPGGTALATLTVVGAPTFSKNFAPNPIRIGATSTLSFTITNPNTTVGLTGIVFNDVLPTGLAVSDATTNNVCGTGSTLTVTASSRTIALAGGNLTTTMPNNTCTFGVTVTGTAVGAQANTTSNITSNESAQGGTASATLNVFAPATVVKTFAPTGVQIGGVSTLTITITNPANNPGALNGLSFTDNFPAGLEVDATPNVMNSCNGMFTDASNGAIGGGDTGIKLAGGFINTPGQSCAVKVNVKGATAGQKVNNVVVNSTEGGMSLQASATLNVAAPPTISKNFFGAGSIQLNASTSLSFTINNPNAGLGLTGIGFTDTFPAGLVVATPNSLSNSCGGTVTAVAGSGSVSLMGGTLVGGGNCTIALNVTGTTAGNKSNTTGVISSNESGAGATSNTATIVVIAPPQLSKAFGPASILTGATSTLTFTLTNPAANTVTLNGVAFTDNLPAGLQVASPNSLSNTCGGTPTATPGTTVISLSGVSLNTNSSCQFSVNVTATSAGAKNNVSNNVTATNGGTGNQASATLTVNCPGITVNPATLPNGGVGLAYAATTFSATGGATPYSFSVSSGTLPNGLTLSGATLSGTPAEGGAFNLTIKATDNFGCMGTRAYTLIINRPPVLAPIGNKSVAPNQTLTFTALATDPDPSDTLSYSLLGAPAGATINSGTGQFSWTPTVAQSGLHTFTVKVTDNGAPQLSDSETITVNVANLPPTLTLGVSYLNTNPANVGLSAQLRDSFNHLPIPGKVISFRIGAQTVTGTTDGNGVAQGQIQVAAPGTYAAKASFAGDANYPMAMTVTSFNVTLNGQSCSFTRTPASQSFAAQGGTGTVQLTTLSSNCNWSAASTVPWITLTSGLGGTGNVNATVGYTVAANPDPTPRTGTINIAGLIFTVVQGMNFLDVPVGHPFYTEIGKLAARGVTLGCGGGNYCPDASVTREQMAAFLIRALGNFNPPAPAMQRFLDVPPANPFYAFIEQMALRQITLGCGGGNYCPAQNVTREQMAAFIIRALHAPGYVPPTPAMQRFLDVPPANPFYAHIDEMAVRQITLGCGGGNYCPAAAVTRGAMAAFLVRAFGL